MDTVKIVKILNEIEDNLDEAKRLKDTLLAIGRDDVIPIQNALIRRDKETRRNLITLVYN